MRKLISYPAQPLVAQKLHAWLAVNQIDARCKQVDDEWEIWVLDEDLNAEKGVLGSILLMPDVIDDVILIIRAEDYFDEAHQKLYQTMKDMHDDGQKIDTMLLRRTGPTCRMAG